MAKAIVMPKLGNTTEECILNAWRVAVGDTIEEGDIIADIETDKATFELEATDEGTVLALLCEEGDAVPVMQNILVVGEEGESTDGFEAAAPAEQDAAASTDVPSVGPAGPAVPVSGAAPSAGAGVSPRARGLAAAKGINPSMVAGSGPGGRVIERDIIAAAETQGPMTPLAKAVAAEKGMAAPAMGSGIGGRVLAMDLVEGGGEPMPAASGNYEEIKLSGIRKIISARMHESLAYTAQLTLHAEAPAGAMMALRKKVKADTEGMGLGNITINDMVLFAVSRVLPKHPALNGTFDQHRFLQYEDVNLAFACTTDRGLMVPVINKAQKLPIKEMSVQVKDLAGQARSGSINPDLLQGGTITISNLGMVGITKFTPIINYPQVAILGVNTISLRPIRRDGEVVFEDHIGFSLTINHQVIDGWDGGVFLQDLVAAVADIEEFIKKES